MTALQLKPCRISATSSVNMRQFAKLLENKRQSPGRLYYYYTETEKAGGFSLSSPKPARALRQTTSITRLCNGDVQEPYSQDASVTVHTAAPEGHRRVKLMQQINTEGSRHDAMCCWHAVTVAPCFTLNPTVNKKILNSIKCLKWDFSALIYFPEATSKGWSFRHSVRGTRIVISSAAWNWDQIYGL